MTLTLLLDLDDTLLSNDAEITIPAYLRALGQHMAAHAAPDALVAGVMAGTGRMLANNDPRLTLEEAFDRAFYPQLELTKSALADDLADFYARVYPTLTEHIAARPVAQRFIKDALAAGHTLAITTNPLFPRAAIEARIAFAQLPASVHDFALITTYEESHFAKPNPAYLAESLARLGWPEGGVVMVGNDPVRDMQSAGELGLASFYINETPLGTPNGLGLARRHGDLDGLLPWIASQNDDDLTPAFDQPGAINAVLRATPAVLDTWLRVQRWLGDWKARPAADEWSLTEILCHFRDVEREVSLPRLNTMLNHDNPFIESVEADEWAAQRDYWSQDGEQALLDFVDARLEALAILDKLPSDAWARGATHSIFGPITIQELFRINARHDRLHVRQTKTILEAVGR
jgi:FMN phosphatase YigB (HAD superfamily)